MINSEFCLVLQSIPGVFNRTIKQLEEKDPAKGADYWLDHFEKEGKISKEERQKKMQWAKDTLKKTMDEGIHFVSLWDKNYPFSLSQIADPPAILFFRGQLPPQQNVYCIVGTRTPRSESLHRTNQLMDFFAQKQFVSISGLARGIDTQVHAASLRQNIKNFAVLGSGLNYVYPYENKELAQKIVAQGGGVLSEFLPETPPDRFRFPQRNRIMSGLSKAVILVEAKIKSGAMGTCKWALEQNRDIYALPPIFGSEYFTGNTSMINQGAYILGTPEDLTGNVNQSTQLGLFASSDTASKTSMAPSGQIDQLEEQDQFFVQKIPDNGIHKEDLAHKMGWTLSQLEVKIFQLTKLGFLRQGRNNFLFRV